MCPSDGKYSVFEFMIYDRSGKNGPGPATILFDGPVPINTTIASVFAEYPYIAANETTYYGMVPPEPYQMNRLYWGCAILFSALVFLMLIPRVWHKGEICREGKKHHGYTPFWRPADAYLGVSMLAFSVIIGAMLFGVFVCPKVVGENAWNLRAGDIWPTIMINYTIMEAYYVGIACAKLVIISQSVTMFCPLKEHKHLWYFWFNKDPQRPDLARTAELWNVWCWPKTPEQMFTWCAFLTKVITIFYLTIFCVNIVPCASQDDDPNEMAENCKEQIGVAVAVSTFNIITDAFMAVLPLYTLSELQGMTRMKMMKPIAIAFLSCVPLWFAVARVSDQWTLQGPNWPYLCARVAISMMYEQGASLMCGSLVDFFSAGFKIAGKLSPVLTAIVQTPGVIWSSTFSRLSLGMETDTDHPLENFKKYAGDDRKSVDLEGCLRTNYRSDGSRYYMTARQDYTSPPSDYYETMEIARYTDTPESSTYYDTSMSQEHYDVPTGLGIRNSDSPVGTTGSGLSGETTSTGILADPFTTPQPSSAQLSVGQVVRDPFRTPDQSSAALPNSRNSRNLTYRAFASPVQTPVESRAQTPVESRAQTPIESRAQTPVPSRPQTPIASHPESPDASSAETTTTTAGRSLIPAAFRQEVPAADQPSRPRNTSWEVKMPHLNFRR